MTIRKLQIQSHSTPPENRTFFYPLKLLSSRIFSKSCPSSNQIVCDKEKESMLQATTVIQIGPKAFAIQNRCDVSAKTEKS